MASKRKPGKVLKQETILAAPLHPIPEEAKSNAAPDLEAVERKREEAERSRLDYGLFATGLPFAIMDEGPLPEKLSKEERKAARRREIAEGVSKNITHKYNTIRI